MVNSRITLILLVLLLMVVGPASASARYLSYEVAERESLKLSRSLCALQSTACISYGATCKRKSFNSFACVLLQTLSTEDEQASNCRTPLRWTITHGVSGGHISETVCSPPISAHQEPEH